VTHREALRWLDQVGGLVFPNQDACDRDETWVAVVSTPPAQGNNGKIIVAFGGSIRMAADAAEEQWQNVWRSLSDLH